MPEETAVAASSSTEAVEEKPCSSSAAESSVDVAEEAKKLIGTGNRHLVMGDVVSAVSVFQEACAMLAEKYGDTADECGEAFFLCGKSLLELARMENSVLGNALEGVPEESSEEGEKQNDSKIESADNLDDAEDDDDDDDEDNDDEEAADANAEDKEEEEDVGNLQLAWEMLEVAKVIYKRKESQEDQLMAAQIFLKLGEVGAESGNYSQALEDFQECLAIQVKHLPPHSRLLAETHYQLGMTFSYTGQYSQAIQHFSSSIKVIESRLAMLQEIIDKTEGAEGAAEEKRELEELKQLLPEISEKVEDAKESQRTAAVASEAIHQTLGGASTSSGFATENGASSSSTAAQIAVKPADGASSSKSASDISHLVRKKRKPEDESPKKDSDAKKVKQETTINGSADSASNSNGVQEKMEQEAVNSSTSAEATA
ncbi:hypothetical protein KOW79_009658 [Hemibagrus wyckioides]|uniref:Tetratricopeptide SHNi-TPR domain-containing protein n=1 Tax=Hemibagrus wyckioides TaxID=337641 RepID=A0A9D3SJD1_9TELE|nr:nuclear autoantigenic sperm protein isoform X3 [Hemibagrus wyckioides]KAG7326257.1 hypothetical protein KOW79_009658 [Hemibagrus wyckioides]